MAIAPAWGIGNDEDGRWRGSPMPAALPSHGPVPVSIYWPAASAVQSGRANASGWVPEFEPASPPEIEPLMGWIGSTDTQKQVRLVFPTRESAVAFAERHGRDCTVHAPRERTLRPKSYVEQFTLAITRAAA